MTDKFDYVNSILSLFRQAEAQAAQGNRKGLQDAAESLRAVQADCDKAMAELTLSETDRAWFQSKRDEASGLLV